MADLIHSGMVHRYLELPEWPDVVSRGYINFLYLTPLKPDLFDQVSRIASLTDLGQALVQAKVFTFFSGEARARAD